MQTNRITRLFGIQYPIIQAGMIWCSNWELAAAVSEAGGLGLLGAGSMYSDTLREQIRQAKKATSKPFGVNIPLLYPELEEHFRVILEEKVPIVFTSAGNPRTYTGMLKSHGIKVVHVISNTRFAHKAAEAGVDAIVAEGFEAGGHNGREETTSLVLLPLVRKEVDLPLIAAGGFADGRAMLAAMVLGADGIQVGSRFVASLESSAHSHFKEAILQAREGDTQLVMKQLTPVRLLKNPFYEKIEEAELRGASLQEMKDILGKGRAKTGMFHGNMHEGELEIGQVSAGIREILPAAEIVRNFMKEYHQALAHIREGGIDLPSLP